MDTITMQSANHQGTLTLLKYNGGIKRLPKGDSDVKVYSTGVLIEKEICLPYYCFC